MKIKIHTLNIVMCCIYLTISVILTWCGVDFLNEGAQVESLFKISEFLNKHFVLKIIIVCVTSFILNSLSLLTMLKQKHFTNLQLLIFTPVMISMSISSWFSPVLNLICNILFLGTPVIFLKKKFYRVIVVSGLVAIFQQGLMFIRNIGNWYLTPQSSVYAAFTLQIDMFVVMLICYLFSIRKEV